MERKNIFQRIEENYNISDELRKIDRLFKEKKYFLITHTDYNGYKTTEDHTLTYILETYIFDEWELRGTCIDIEEFFNKADAKLPSKFEIDEESATNYIEVILNLIKLFRDNELYLEDEYDVGNYSDFYHVFCPLVETVKKRLGLTERIIDNGIIVYPEKAPLEQVLNIITDENAQWELIRYCREKMDLSEKRKSLAYLATAFYIETDKNDNEPTKLIVEKATNILNNLHIRHNNQTGRHEKEYLKDITDAEAISLCDLLYNQILTIILLREQKKYDMVYKAFKDKQKTEKE